MKNKIVYADPPYTRDHYSRFYHVLETISLFDSPIVSKTKMQARLKIAEVCIEKIDTNPTFVSDRRLKNF